jgi:hypothetical protein
MADFSGQWHSSFMHWLPRRTQTVGPIGVDDLGSAGKIVWHGLPWRSVPKTPAANRLQHRALSRNCDMPLVIDPHSDLTASELIGSPPEVLAVEVFAVDEELDDDEEIEEDLDTEDEEEDDEFDEEDFDDDFDDDFEEDLDDSEGDSDDADAADDDDEDGEPDLDEDFDDSV